MATKLGTELASGRRFSMKTVKSTPTSCLQKGKKYCNLCIGNLLVSILQNFNFSLSLLYKYSLLLKIFWDFHQSFHKSLYYYFLKYALLDLHVFQLLTRLKPHSKPHPFLFFSFYLFIYFSFFCTNCFIFSFNNLQSKHLSVKVTHNRKININWRNIFLFALKLCFLQISAYSETLCPIFKYVEKRSESRKLELRYPWFLSTCKKMDL